MRAARFLVLFTIFAFEGSLVVAAPASSKTFHIVKGKDELHEVIS
jgi:hypothetical protein